MTRASATAARPKTHRGECAALVGLPCRLCDLVATDAAYADALLLLPKHAGDAVGDELKALLNEAGVNDVAGCGCADYAARLNSWGVEGCRARRAEIIETLWQRRVKASPVKASVEGVERHVIGAYVDEAIARAERKRPRRTTYIGHGQGNAGLGDALLGLCIVLGWCDAHPGQLATYGAAKHTIAFTGMFEHPPELGFGWGVNPSHARGDLQIGVNFGAGARDDPHWTRLGAYGRELGDPEPRLPALRDRERLKAAGSHYAGAVVIAPCVSKPQWGSREWSRARWLELAARLRSSGRRVVIADDNAGRMRSFLGFEIALGWPADQLVPLVLNAACLVGNDSGLAHLSGILGIPTVVLCGPTRGDQVFGFYPRVDCVQGKLQCDGCWWGKPYNSSCDAGCPSMGLVTVEDVVERVEVAERRGKAKVRVVSNFSREYRPLSNLTWPSKRRYAELHGLDWHNAATKSSLDWRRRLRFWAEQLSLMPPGGYVWAIGCDAAITGKRDVTDLLAGDPDVVVSADANGLNLDSVLLRNTESVRGHLVELSRGGHQDDQAAMSALLAGVGNYWEFRAALGHPLRCGGYAATMGMLSRMAELFSAGPLRVNLICQRELNAYPASEYGLPDGPDHWQRRDLVCHLPGKSLADRLEFFGRLSKCDDARSP